MLTSAGSPPAHVSEFDTVLIIFNGESNSGGYAQNEDATEAELAPRSAVQILNNYTFAFEDLDIGTNNLLDHYNLTEGGPTHGWELGLANEVEAHVFPQAQVHLVKTGQGGTQIHEWVEPETGYQAKLVERVTAAKAILDGQGKTYFPVLWYSQGVNDAEAPGYTIDYWQEKTMQHLADIRALFSATLPILMTYIPPSSISGFDRSDLINARIDLIVASDPHTFAVQTADATMRDTNHWNYLGMKLIASRMIDKTLTF